MKLTIALFSIIFGLCLAQETKVNWILKDSTLRTRCTLNMETSVLECDGPASKHVKCNVKHNMTLVHPMKFEHFAIEYTPVEGTEIPAGLLYHLYPRQVEKNVWFHYNVTIPTVGEVSVGLFYQHPTGFGIEIVDQVCGTELFKLLQASTEHEEIVIEGGVSEVVKVMVIGEVVIVPGSAMREESELWYGRNGGWRGGRRYRDMDNEDSEAYGRYGGYRSGYRGGYRRWRDADTEESEDMMNMGRMGRDYGDWDENSERLGRYGGYRGGYRRYRDMDNEDSDVWIRYGGWRGGNRRYRDMDNEDSDIWVRYGGRRGGRWYREKEERMGCKYENCGEKREIYKYYRESMSTGDLALRTKCQLRNSSTIMECVGPVETVVCDVVSNFTGLGSTVFELYGIGEPIIVNGELTELHLYPRTLDNKQFLNYVVPVEGKDVTLCLYQKEDVTKFGIRVETPECFHRIHEQFKLAVKPEEIMVNNVPVKLVGEILV